MHRRLCALSIAVATTFALLLAIASRDARADNLLNVAPDRSNKTCLVRRLTTRPRIVLVGSSVFSKADPAQITATTGLRAFNASVSHGNADDAWAFYNLIHDAHPAVKQQLIWLFDLETFRGRGGPDHDLLRTQFTRRYVLPAFVSRRGESAAQLTARQASLPSYRDCALRTNSFTSYHSDGYRAHDYHDRNLANGETQAESIQATVDEYSVIYRDHYRSLDEGLKARFVSTMKVANTLGVRPIIVLAPMHPRFVEALQPFGYAERSRQVMAFLRAAQQRVSFTLLDARRVSTFGATTADFFDGVHLQRLGMRKLWRWIYAGATQDWLS